MMVVKVASGTLLVGLLGVLVAGAILRTVHKAEDVAEARALGQAVAPANSQDTACSSTGVSLKLVQVLAMIAVSLIRSLVLGRRSEPPAPAQEKLKVRLLYFNLVLGHSVPLGGSDAALLAGPPPI